MKIVAAVRTRNEENNIGRFIEAYQFWADQILVADGGSEDATVEIARSYSKVEVRHFDQVVERNGLVRNPENEHINFLIDWAEEEGADWITFDDCDCIPNRSLREKSRPILEATPAHVVLIHRLYIVGEESYLPRMNDPGPSLWAWRPGRARAENLPGQIPGWHMHIKVEPESPSCIYLKLQPPFALLHYGWPDMETLDRKMNFYQTSGAFGKMEQSPIEAFGPPENLPEWAAP